MHNFKIIILMGPPACGKGTQASFLKKNYNFFHFEVSRMILRKFEEQKQDPKIQKLKEEFKAGIITDPIRVASWIKEDLEKSKEDLRKNYSGIVFDGGLRTLQETEVVYPYLEKEFGKENILAIYINVKPETAIFRSVHRKVCESCARPLIFTKETENQETCSACGGKLVKRELDRPEVIKKRLAVYEKDTKPVFTYLKNLGILREVDGEGSVEEIFGHIKKILGTDDFKE